MNVDPEIVVVAVAVMAVASTVQASVGFGANMLATPVFAILDPDLVPGPIFVAAGILTFATALRERDGVDREVVTVATAGRIPGSIVGAFVLAAVSDRSLQLLVGATILVAVVLSSGILRIPERRGTYLGAGALSGFGATTAAIGGPPLALTLQHRSGRDLRATMGAYFAIGSVITLPAIAAAGRLGRDELVVGACLIPGALLGFVASGPLRPRVDAGRVRPLVLGLAGIAAVILIIRTI
ncbi:MAG: sulfite exporter TauE/SafE family protein [Actinomycetota bacterium]